MALYGGGDGDDWSAQKKAILEGVDILVATPGKLISHLNLGYVDFSSLSFLVLDEADRMLDIGFFDDILKIVSFLPEERQNLMFSATMPPKIRDLSKRILNSPQEISIAISKPAEGVLQASYLVYDENKIPLICELIKGKEENKSIIIFSSTKKQVSSIVRYLNKHKIAAKGISSDLEQDEREQVLLDFRNKKVRVLVATDVISRGIDIKDINLVINYNVPSDAEDYVHRIGRTARADTTGVAITLINNDDMFSFKKIEDLIEKEVVKIPTPSSIGESPEWKVSDRRPNNKRHFNKKKGNFKRKKS
jgi:superfamily II DNA/RNA helicase